MKTSIKKSLSILLSIMMLLSITAGIDLSAYAATSGKCGENVNYRLNTSTGTLTISGNGSMFDYDVYYSQTNTSPFASNKSIKEVVINNGVTHIGSNAFGYCPNLKMVSFNSDLISIGEYAFESTALYDITIPNSVTSIGKGAFRCCDALINVTLSKSLTEISDFLFESSNIRSINIPSGVTKIGEGAFEWCTFLNTVKLPDTLQTIGKAAFCDCYFITSLNLPASLKAIGESAFEEIGIKSLVIPSGVTSIGKTAFQNCLDLETVSIPKTVTFIGENAFYNCEGLTSITVATANQSYSSSNGVLFNKDKTKLIKYPDYKRSSRYTVPKTVTTIAKNAFANNKEIGKVVMQSGLTTIGESAFDNCSWLEYVTLPDTLKTIGKGAFQLCDCLEDVTIPKSVRTIGDYAFFYTGIESITIPNGVTSIGNYTFAYNEYLTSVKLPASLKTIGANAFTACEELKSINIPRNVTSIGYGAFEACISLKKIYLPKSIQAIDDYAFYDCSKLTDVYYYGSKANWGNVKVKTGNAKLKNATFHYNYVPPCKVHKYDNGKVTKAPTSSATGVMTYTCSVCGAKKTSQIAKLVKTSISKLTAKSKGFTVYWSKVSSASGYQIQYSTSSKFTNPKSVTISGNSNASKSITKLTAKKKYYVRVRTYRVINGKKYYSAWSGYKYVTTKS